ncbi:ABC transporter permease subunit [uncultured Roseobacter sp.]|uniref:ABC transporter permease subunit n=1 Tax=uncultured Roseobacter sp. TaxID=114847 RepID=UPI00262568F8|nr:ABC transporter permease subunit [uncultured Roseobacter sp.]
MHRSLTQRLFAHAVLLAGVLFLIVPVLLVFAASTQPTSVLVAEGLSLVPGRHGLENFRTILTLQAGFTDQIIATDMLRNSMIVATGIGVATTGLSLLAAYGLVMFRLPPAGAFFWITLATLLLPLESRFITTFQITSYLGLINTHTGMILPAVMVALGTLFFRQLFLSFPGEYIEAARLDGAGPVRFFVDFILPLSRERGGAVFVVSFMIGWNQYLWPLMISTDERHYTLVRGIRLIGQESGPGMALVVLTILPPLLLVILFQRWFLRALEETRDAF